VIRDFRLAQVLWVRSDTAHRLVAPVRSYLTKAELQRFAGSIRQFKITGDVPAGTDRMFQTRVTVLSAHRADVSTCDDTSGYRAKNLATGNLDSRYTVPVDQQYLYEIWHMARLGAHWAIDKITVVMLPDPRAKPCHPNCGWDRSRRQPVLRGTRWCGGTWRDEFLYSILRTDPPG
jgi:hypothetical protein